MRWTPWLVLIGLMGCDNTVDRSPFAANSLSPATVESEEELSSSRRDFGGSISVDGSAGDFTVAALTSNGRGDADVRSPTRADVEVFDGIEGQLSLGIDPLSDELSVMVTDDNGDLMYLLETIQPTVLTDSAFVPNFVTPGSDLGSFPVSSTELQIRSAFVLTDDGEIEVFPGTPLEIVVGGLSFRFTLIASWSRTTAEGVGINCSLDDILSFEVVRVDPGTAQTTVLERAETDSIDGNACGF